MVQVEWAVVVDTAVKEAETGTREAKEATVEVNTVSRVAMGNREEVVKEAMVANKAATTMATGNSNKEATASNNQHNNMEVPRAMVVIPAATDRPNRTPTASNSNSHSSTEAKERWVTMPKKLQAMDHREATTTNNKVILKVKHQRQQHLSNKAMDNNRLKVDRTMATTARPTWAISSTHTVDKDVIPAH